MSFKRGGGRGRIQLNFKPANIRGNSALKKEVKAMKFKKSVIYMKKNVDRTLDPTKKRYENV